MGLFDTVIIHCPRCQTPNKNQTKAGGCNLDTFQLSEVSPAIAGDLATEVVVCESCAAEIRFDVQFLVRPYI